LVAPPALARAAAALWCNSKLERILRRFVSPGRLQRRSHRDLIDRFQEDCRAPSFSPCAFRRNKRIWMFLQQPRLFFGRQDHNAVMLVGITEGREYFSSDAKIGMTHVCAFRRFGKADGEPAKFSGSHGV
jgi:hypothetical protein